MSTHLDFRCEDCGVDAEEPGEDPVKEVTQVLLVLLGLLGLAAMSFFAMWSL